MTSSTSSGESLARSSAPLIANAPSSCASNEPSAPLKDPTGVRAADTITTSVMTNSLFNPTFLQLQAIYGARSSKPSGFCHRSLEISRVNVAIERNTQLVPIKFTLPPGHDHAGNAVAAEICKGATFAHELVDAEHDRHAGKQLGPDRGERACNRDEAGTRDARSAF